MDKLTPLYIVAPRAWLCELAQEDGTTRTQLVDADPAGYLGKKGRRPMPKASRRVLISRVLTWLMGPGCEFCGCTGHTAEDGTAGTTTAFTAAAPRHSPPPAWTAWAPSCAARAEETPRGNQHDAAGVHGGVVRVRGQGKDTKAAVARVVKLNSRALAVLKRQKAYTFLAGEGVFGGPNHVGSWTDEKHVAKRCWAPTLKRLGMRYRVPYTTRHTYATLMLMEGMNAAFCARQMGHSVELFMRVCTRWLDGARDDLEMAKVERRLAARAGAVAQSG